MEPFDLIIFDCDSVLVDSEPIGNQVLVDVLGGFGVKIAVEDGLSRFVGLSTNDIGSMVVREFGITLPENCPTDITALCSQTSLNEWSPYPALLR